MDKLYFKLIAVFLIGIMIGCGGGEKAPEAASGKFKIACTTGMIADMLRNIAGEQAEINALMGPGVDPHLYKASQGDIKILDQADAIFYNGLHLEGKLQEILEKMARKKKVVPISQNLPENRLRSLDGKEELHDPHIWFDVQLWAMTIDLVVDELSALDEQNALLFRQRGEAYFAELDSLHEWILEQISTIPEEQRVLITAHDAFAYFGKIYNIEVMGLQGISTMAEYGLNDVTRLVDLVVERQIKAVFVESSVSQRSINAVKEGCKAKGYEVKIGGTLYSDAMGAPGSGADNYIGMVKLNVEAIVSALK